MHTSIRHLSLKITVSEYLQMNCVAFTVLCGVYAAVDAGSGLLYPCTPRVLLTLFAMTSAVAAWCLLLTRLLKRGWVFAAAGIAGGAAIVFGIGVSCGTIPYEWVYALVVLGMVALVFASVWIYYLIRGRRDAEELNRALRAMHRNGKDR